MSWLSWPFRLLGFAAWFAMSVVAANVGVGRDILSPGQASTPGVAYVDSRCRTEFEVALLGILINLQPGTVTMGANTFKDASGTTLHGLYTHAMYRHRPEEVRQDVAGLEKRMLNAVRRKGFDA